MEQPHKRNPSPADYLANERTYLAWIRTGIAIMAFGFVVVKFALFIDQINFVMGKSFPVRNQHYSLMIGMALVALGTVLSILSYLRFRQIDRQLKESDFRSSIVLGLLLIISIVLVGILLLLYVFSNLS